MTKHNHGEHGGDDRHGARQPERFDPARAALLDEPSRFEYLRPDEVFALCGFDGLDRAGDLHSGGPILR